MGLRTRLGLWLLRSGLKAASNADLRRFLVPSWLDRQPVWTSWSPEKAVKEGYKANVWVYACVRKLAQSVSSVPWLVYRDNPDGEDERIPNHPLEKLLRRPNPYMSGQDLFETLAAHLNLAGNHYWGVLETRGKPAEIIVIQPQYIKPVPSSTNYLEAYEIMIDGQPRRVDPREILHFMFIDPGNPWVGLAPLEAAARTVDTDNEQLNWNKISMQNRAVADGAFTVKEELTKDQYESLKEIIREQHQGSGKAREPWVLHSGATWQQMALSPVEMDFIESRKLNREEICAVYGVPPVLVGDFTHATYENYGTAFKAFWTDTVASVLEDIAHVINLNLAPRFGDDILVKPDLTKVPAMQEILRERVDTAAKLFAMGVPFNQINDRLGLGFQPLEHGDEGYLPFSLMPAGGVREIPAAERQSPDEEVSDEEPSDEETSGKGRRSRQVKGIQLRTEEQKAAYWKAYDRDRRAWENAIAKKIADRFDAEAKAVAKAYEDGGSLDSVLEAQRAEWTKVLTAAYMAVIEHFGNRFVEQWLKGAGGSLETKEFVFDPWADRILQWVATWAAQKIVGIEDATKQRIAAVIKQGLDADEGTAKIAKRIREEYEDFSRYRSFVIARTEVGAASGFASHESAKQTGLQLKKQWVSSRDDRVRESHMEMDGEEREMDESYSNGCMFPSDPSGPPEEVIQCRCTEAYLVPE